MQPLDKDGKPLGPGFEVNHEQLEKMAGMLLRSGAKAVRVSSPHGTETWTKRDYSARAAMLASKYMPHQGRRECARRRKQAARTRDV